MYGIRLEKVLVLILFFSYFATLLVAGYMRLVSYTNDKNICICTYNTDGTWPLTYEKMSVRLTKLPDWLTWCVYSYIDFCVASGV